MKFESLVPILYSADIPRSIAYYTNVLEFEEHWAWDEMPTFGGGTNRGCKDIFLQGQPGASGHMDMHQLRKCRRIL